MVAPALLLALAAHAASPASAAVVLTRRVDVPRAVAQEVVRAVSTAAAARGLAVSSSATVAAQKARAAAEACGGKSACVVEAGRKLGVQVLIGVQVGSLGSTIAVYVDAVRLPDGEKLADHNTPIPNDKLDDLPGLDGFLSRLLEALASAPPVVEKPRPGPAHPTVVVQPPVAHGPGDPARVPPEAIATGPAEPPRSHAAGYAMTAVAAVTAVGAVACLAFGLALKSPLEKDPSGHIDLMYADAASRRDTVNALLVTSAVAGGVAVLSGGTALLVW